MLNKGNVLLLYFVAFCVLFLSFVDYVGAGAVITPDQLVQAQNNGLVSGMCFVLNIITGNVARGVMAVFVIGTGWLFLLGGVDWKKILLFTVASAVTFGGTELANIISRNNYTCAKSNSSSTAPTYNAGDCQVIDLPLYMIGQKWYKCSGVGASVCNTLIGNTTVISEGDTVALGECNTGYLKMNDNIKLKYKCENVNGIKRFTTTETATNIGNGKCRKACTTNDLYTLMRNNNASLAPATSGNYAFITDSQTGFTGRIQGSYFVQSTTINLDCNNGYDEYGSAGTLNNSGLMVTCSFGGDTHGVLDTGGTFHIFGSCGKKCIIESATYSKRVSQWEKSESADTASATWATINNSTVFYSGDKARIKACKNGYYFKNSTANKLSIRCNSSGSWMVNETGENCLSRCNISDYSYFDRHTWRKDCVLGGACTNELGAVRVFYEGDIVGVNTCISTEDSIDESKNKLRLTCGANGDWTSDGGEICLKKCNIEGETIANSSKKINGIAEFDRVASWDLCNKDGTNCITVPDSTRIVDNGKLLKQRMCKDGFIVNTNKASQFLCTDGVFKRVSGTADVICAAGCFFSALGDDRIVNNNNAPSTQLIAIDMKSSTWVNINDSSDVVNVTLVENVDRKAYHNSYYKINLCKVGNKAMEPSVVVKCNAGNWEKSSNVNNVCHPPCNIANWKSTLHVATVEKHTQSSSSYTGLLATENSIDNGDTIRVTSCMNGYSLDSSVTNFTSQCRNESLVNSNSSTPCKLKCTFAHSSLPGTTVFASTWGIVGTSSPATPNVTIVDHGVGIKVNTCASGYVKLNENAVFRCNNGAIEVVTSNPLTSVCVRGT
jgi:type IV secretory pathway VirB2 component (pilin)